MNKSIYIALSAIVSIMMNACKPHEADETAHNHNHSSLVEEKEHHDSDEIVLEPSDAERFGVKTRVVEPTNINEIKKVVGQILYSPESQIIITAPKSGVITISTGISNGTQIRQGAAIAKISTNSLSGGNQDHAAKAKLDAAKRELDRITPLFNDGLVTKSQMNSAQEAYDIAKALFSPQAASGLVSSSSGGVLTNLLVSSGQYVEAGAPVATISKNTRLTLRTDLPANSYNQASSYLDANIRTAESNEWVSLSSLGGKRINPANAAPSSQQGYVPIYFSFENNGIFTPGAFCEINLIGNSVHETLSVPNSALSEQQGQNFVYVKIDDHGYLKKPVRLGVSNGIETEILSGLSSGDDVVTDGVVFIRLAETSDVMPEGHTHNH